MKALCVDVWNRREIFWKLKISQGVRTDYNDRISKTTKIANIVNFTVNWEMF